MLIKGIGTIFFISLVILRLINAPFNLESVITTCIIVGFVIFGYDLFGFFRLRALQFLGTIGYSIYLLHMCIFGIVNYFIIGRENVSKITYTELIGLSIILSSSVVIISLFTYKNIEERGIKFGKKLRF